MHKFLLFALLLATLALSACYNNSDNLISEQIHCGSEMTLGQDMSTGDLAKRCNVNEIELIRLNKLETSKLKAGMVLKIPEPQTYYQVKPGDTLTGIAKANRLSIQTLASNNNLTPKARLYVGQWLLIPKSTAPATPPPLIVAVPSKPLKPVIDEQTITTTDLAPPPPENPVPAAAPTSSLDTTPLPVAPPATPPVVSSAKREYYLPLQPQIASPHQTGQAVATASPPTSTPLVAPNDTPAEPPLLAPPPPTGKKTFIWPLHGEVITPFDSKNDGVNIKAPAGTTVSAASGGVIVYVGNELRGFGNLILIKHADGFITAYAHLGKILVHPNQRVTQGQMIGTVGKTGLVDEPQLHFELRNGTQTVNPNDYISGKP